MDVTKNLDTQQTESPARAPDFKEKDWPLAVAIWTRKSQVEGSASYFYDVTLSRTYKDKDGNWQSTHRLGKNDLFKAQRLLARAYDWVVRSEAEAREGNGFDREESSLSELSQ